MDTIIKRILSDYRTSNESMVICVERLLKMIDELEFDGVSSDHLAGAFGFLGVKNDLQKIHDAFRLSKKEIIEILKKLKDIINQEALKLSDLDRYIQTSDIELLQSSVNVIQNYIREQSVEMNKISAHLPDIVEEFTRFFGIADRSFQTQADDYDKYVRDFISRIKNMQIDEIGKSLEVICGFLYRYNEGWKSYLLEHLGSTSDSLKIARNFFSNSHGEHNYKIAKEIFEAETLSHEKLLELSKTLFGTIKSGDKEIVEIIKEKVPKKTAQIPELSLQNQQ